MLAAVLMVLLGLGVMGTPPPGFDYPHIPWMAIEVASKAAAYKGLREDCRSSSATFLLLLLQGKQAIAKTIMVRFKQKFCPFLKLQTQ